MIRRPTRSTPLYSSAASDVYRRGGARGRRRAPESGPRARPRGRGTRAAERPRQRRSRPPPPLLLHDRHGEVGAEGEDHEDDAQGDGHGPAAAARLLHDSRREHLGLALDVAAHHHPVSYTHLTLPTNREV